MFRSVDGRVDSNAGSAFDLSDDLSGRVGKGPIVEDALADALDAGEGAPVGLHVSARGWREGTTRRVSRLFGSGSGSPIAESSDTFLDTALPGVVTT